LWAAVVYGGGGVVVLSLMGLVGGGRTGMGPEGTSVWPFGPAEYRHAGRSP